MRGDQNRVDKNAGHGLGKPWSKLVEEIGDRRAFATDATGLDTH